MSLIRRLFGANAAAPPDAAKLDGTTEAALARSLTALPPDERGWITFAEATSSRSPRSTTPSSISCRSRSGSISYATRKVLNDNPSNTVAHRSKRKLRGGRELLAKVVPTSLGHSIIIMTLDTSDRAELAPSEKALFS